jgi:hypothetical protein
VSGSGPSSSLDPAGGWYLHPRAFRESAVYRALRTAERRHVAELILFDLPHFRDEEHWFGAHRFVVKRGQLFHAEETIARTAGTSRKVVRTVLSLLERAGLVVRQPVHPSGQCPHVVTVLYYDLSQALPSNAGPRKAHGADSEGPEKGQRGASVEQKQPQQPQQPQEPQELFASAPSAPAPHDESPSSGSFFVDTKSPKATRPEKKRATTGTADPRHQPTIALFCRLWTDLRGGTYRVADGKDGAAVKRLLAYPEARDEEIERRARRAFSDPWFLEHGGLATFVSKWSTWAPPRPSSAIGTSIRGMVAAMPPEAFNDREEGFGS